MIILDDIYPPFFWVSIINKNIDSFFFYSEKYNFLNKLKSKSISDFKKLKATAFFVDLEGNKYTILKIKKKKMIWTFHDILFLNPWFEVEYIFSEKKEKIEFEELKQISLRFTKRTKIYNDIKKTIQQAENFVELAKAFGWKSTTTDN
jgi:hypothetical protein